VLTAAPASSSSFCQVGQDMYKVQERIETEKALRWGPLLHIHWANVTIASKTSH
jgi:hypothetical protein